MIVNCVDAIERVCAVLLFWFGRSSHMGGYVRDRYCVLAGSYGWDASHGYRFYLLLMLCYCVTRMIYPNILYLWTLSNL